MTHTLVGYEGIKVLGARVVIKLEEAENKTSTGIILTSEKEPEFIGDVVATGTGARLENGTQMPMEVSIGDRVIYTRMAGVPIEYNGEKLLVINERDVIAIFTKQ